MRSDYYKRHIGVSAEEKQEMLSIIGCESLSSLIDKTIPENIRLSDTLEVVEAFDESAFLDHLDQLGEKNKLYKSFLGQGYYGTHVPSVIIRNILQNPGWYTQYTPYQAEISQGRLEALINFQTMVSDLSKLPLANASLLDESTAAAEAMSMLYSVKNKKKVIADKFFVDEKIFQQTIDVLTVRALPRNINLVFGDWQSHVFDDSYFGAIIQYPNSEGQVNDYSDFVDRCKANNTDVIAIADLLSLTLLTPPGEWGADVAVGTTQRFGVPMGFGGPHAGYLSATEKYKRNIPGRIIGLSKDSRENVAYRMALQTREQHIKREKATSNICTAQALLAIMAGMYAVYHGPKGLKKIAVDIHQKTVRLYHALKSSNYNLSHSSFFDTLHIKCTENELLKIKTKALDNKINLFYKKSSIYISIDEVTSNEDIDTLIDIFDGVNTDTNNDTCIPKSLIRQSEYLTHNVFNSYHTETSLMRYCKLLENKDISLVHSMIPLGSCTMKLNAASLMLPITKKEFSGLHPFSPIDQCQGYLEIIEKLEHYLCKITQLEACSLQPNSGAQGEFTGLMVIAEYHKKNNNQNRNIALIPQSAHGTNPASAIMAGMQVVIVQCDDNGNIDLSDLSEKVEKYKDSLAALMITYPSTHGVFETNVIEVCDLIHDHGGLVYMDGANMNAQVGLTSPGKIGADVCHLNLHKTFAIPHGGGGPGMGPICVNKKLKPYLPKHFNKPVGGEHAIQSVSSAPWGSANILLISYGYICMLGSEGLVDATQIAILNANYILHRLKDKFNILYKGHNGYCAHELIIDLRKFKSIPIEAEDIAKRLIDYGFHSPTLSFPVPGTIMIEPTESENKAELDRFCEAMLSINEEINEVARGEYPVDDNVLVNSPHTLVQISDDDWPHSYSRTKAVYPLKSLMKYGKFWPSVNRVNNAHGDRNLICTCPPIEAYQEEF